MSNAGRKNAAYRGAARAQSWSPRARRAKLVGEFLPGLMRPAFEKFGFPAATLLTDWEAIAGPKLASYTAPERLKWPRRTGNDDELAADKGAVLFLRVAGAMALEVDHLRPQVIERINTAFGYRAVSNIRIIQAPLPKADASDKKIRSITPAMDDQSLAGLPDGALKQAFARMAAGVKQRQSQPEKARS